MSFYGVELGESQNVMGSREWTVEGEKKWEVQAENENVKKTEASVES